MFLMGRALHQRPVMMKILSLRLMNHLSQKTVHLLKRLRQTTWNATVKSTVITQSFLVTDLAVPISMAQSVMGLNTDGSLGEDTLAEGTSLDITLWISLPLRMALTMSCLSDGLEVSLRLPRMRLQI
jgi:hypothetical protein